MNDVFIESFMTATFEFICTCWRLQFCHIDCTKLISSFGCLAQVMPTHLSRPTYLRQVQEPDNLEEFACSKRVFWGIPQNVGGSVFLIS